MKAIICGANGAMGKLIQSILGDEIVGCVSIDGENGVPKTFSELGHVESDAVIDFSHHTAVIVPGTGAPMSFPMPRVL